MQSTRPDAGVSEESAVSVHRRLPARIVSANAKGAPNKDGNTRSGDANDKASASTNEAVEAVMAKEMARFVERGPPSGPACGVHQDPHPFPGTSPGSALQPAPKASATEKGHITSQTVATNTASLRQKK